MEQAQGARPASCPERRRSSQGRTDHCLPSPRRCRPRARHTWIRSISPRGSSSPKQHRPKTKQKYSGVKGAQNSAACQERPLGIMRWSMRPHQYCTPTSCGGRFECPFPYSTTRTKRDTVQYEKAESFRRALTFFLKAPAIPPVQLESGRNINLACFRVGLAVGVIVPLQSSKMHRRPKWYKFFFSVSAILPWSGSSKKYPRPLRDDHLVSEKKGKSE